MSENRGPQVAGVAGLFLTLSTITVVLRCYCRAIITKSFGIDDTFAVVAWVFFVFFCAFAFAGVAHGTGQHATALPPTEIPVGLKWWWACEPVYVLSNMALKFSIGVFLTRLTPVKLHKIIIWSTVVLLEVYGAFYFFLFVLQCRPSAYFWTRYTGGKGTCIDAKITVDATYAYSAVSCLGDWILAIIPIFVVWKLQMNKRTKISVALILAMAAIASTATIIRIPYVKDLSNEADFLYATTDVAIWSTSETGIGITASCLATIRPLFRTFFLRSRLGTGYPDPSSSQWPKSGARNNGYIRSGAAKDETELGLRSDLSKYSGIKTTIESDVETGGSDTTANTRESVFSTWENADKKSKEGRAEPDWKTGIRKITVSSQVSDRKSDLDFGGKF